MSQPAQVQLSPPLGKPAAERAYHAQRLFPGQKRGRRQKQQGAPPTLAPHAFIHSSVILLTSVMSCGTVTGRAQPGQDLPCTRSHPASAVPSPDCVCCPHPPHSVCRPDAPFPGTPPHPLCPALRNTISVLIRLGWVLLGNSSVCRSRRSSSRDCSH